jgi:hypothetical protein
MEEINKKAIERHALHFIVNNEIYGDRLLKEKLRIWTEKEVLICKAFSALKSYLEQSEFTPSKVYYYKSRDRVDTKELAPYVSIIMSQNLTPFKKFPENGERPALSIEIGESMNISISINGYVSAMIFPAASDHLKINHKFLWVFSAKHPNKLTPKRVENLVKMFLACEQHHTYTGNPSYQDRFWYATAKIKHFWNFFSQGGSIYYALKMLAEGSIKIIPSILKAVPSHKP